MILEFIYASMTKYHWDKLNDDQKFNLALKITFDILVEIINTSSRFSRKEFLKSTEQVDFFSYMDNIYFQYCFWLALEHLNSIGHWFPEYLLAANKNFSIMFIDYEYRKQENEMKLDRTREFKQCAIILRNNKKFKNG